VIVWVIWHGGHSYAPSSNRQRYNSVAAARVYFNSMRRNLNGYTPCVDDSSEMLLFGSPREEEPFMHIFVGRRGGTRTERC